MINEKLKEEILKVISKPIPKGLDIVPQSVPVVFFGNIESAKAVSISLNPSYREFTDDKILSLEKKRFCDRGILNIEDTDTLTNKQAELVYKSCIDYFNKNPYTEWFGGRWATKGLEKYLKPLGYSYYDGTLAHLDLSPWATSKKWSDLKDSIKNKLKEEGRFYTRFLMN